MKTTFSPLFYALFLLIGATGGYFLPMHSANAVTANVNVLAQLNIPLVVSGTTDLNFATVIMVPAGDTVTLNAATGAISGAGGTTFAGTPARGTISLTGTPNASFTVTDPAQIDIAFNGGSAHIQNFVINGGDTQSLDGGSGTKTLQVGAQLRYDASITDGGAISTVAAFTIAYD